MATVSRSASRDEVNITLTADAAEALMQVLVVLSHSDPNHPMNKEFDSVWNGLVDEFNVDAYYASYRYSFKNDENLIVDL